MKIIRVPKTPKSAYDARRVVSQLQISQIELLQRVVRENIKTEEQAGEYIRALTRRIEARHPHIAPVRHGKKPARRTRRAKVRRRRDHR
jgi:hypothetical protein